MVFVDVSEEGEVVNFGLPSMKSGRIISGFSPFSVSDTFLWKRILTEKRQHHEEERQEVIKKERGEEEKEGRVRKDQKALMMLYHYLEAAFTQKERPKVEKKNLGELGELSSEVIGKIASDCSQGRIGAFEGRDKKIVFYPVLLEEYKKIFLRENPDLAFDPEDPNFWEKSAKEKGEYQGEVKQDDTHFTFFYKRYLLQVGGGWFSVDISTGGQPKERAPYQ
ncbi:hypothetical protein KKC60_01670 [Patescibacteria group bacterium]|nr:hypothetical protein [Patescibacteria group bacterium]